MQLIEVKWSVVQWRGLNRGVPWRVFMVGEVQWIEVKWSLVQWRGLNQGVPWRVFMVGEVQWIEVRWSAVKWSEGPVKISVLYLWINNIRNYVFLVFLYAFCFNLYCGGFILFCCCVYMCVCVCVCVCMSGFCNVWVLLVICILYFDWDFSYPD